uniref:Uncharacterized protein n=1 Tax=Gopherus agassizii TaxID=38772 RepID=A0A452HXN2_9SAUR
LALTPATALITGARRVLEWLLMVHLRAAWELGRDPGVAGGEGPSSAAISDSWLFPPPFPSSISILVGAPKANTSQANVTQGGSVYYCPWHRGNSSCTPIEFDQTGKGSISLMWVGASMFNPADKYLPSFACAPLYSWRTLKEESGRDPVGTCYLSVSNFTKFVEYSPCRSGTSSGNGGRVP